MICGCMAADGVGEICEGRMNSQKCINTLENMLMRSLTRSFGDTNVRGVKFQ